MDVLEKSGKKVVLLGNQAIARGAMEAGVGVVSVFPGTPSSEVPTTLAQTAKKVGFYFEYASNEKVAFETAAGAAWSGVRALTSMKHFGLNVAADSVGPVAFTGVKSIEFIVNENIKFAIKTRDNTAINNKIIFRLFDCLE